MKKGLEKQNVIAAINASCYFGFFFLRDVYLTQSDNSNQTQVLTDDQHVNRNTRVQTRLTGNFVEKKMVARATGICR